MRIVILAGELSGDLLGAGLITALRKRYSQARFEGIGGAHMIAQGFHTLYPIEKLSVMGLVEVLAHLPELVRIRWSLYKHFRASPPDVFIGIDSPDFNLPLEYCLRKKGIRTVHYVSPTVWAWRQGRIGKIARSVDLMLTLFPFETAFYRNHRIPVRYVGHPLADEIPLKSDRMAVRYELGIAQSAQLLALLPGSRMSEVGYLGPLFMDTARWLYQQQPELSFMMPAATPLIHHHLSDLRTKHAPNLPITLCHGRSREIMMASDMVLLASGTATLEAMLLKRPMVVAYKVAPMTAWIASRLIKISRFSLPNLLAEQDLVAEFIQQAATVENIGSAVLNLLNDPAARVRMIEAFTDLHRQLRRAASEQAAAAIAELL